jgi:predicted lactoylglutathione lyase
MVGYVTVGTNDFARATKFYDALLSELGASRFMELETFVVWGSGAPVGLLAVTKPFDGKKATVGNGVMVALAARSKEHVDRIYRKALELGGTDEGPPGPRGDGFYAGYFRDLDGNKLNAYFMG